MGQIYRLVQLKEKLKDNQGLLKEIVEASFNYSENLCMRNGVHETLFRSVVEMMGKNDQRIYWGKLLSDYKLFSIQQALENGVTHNDVLLDANRVAELHYATFLYTDNARRFSAINNFSLDTSVTIIMRQMTVLWGLYVLRTYGDQGFLEEYISSQQLKDIEKACLKLCKHLRKDVVGLTDAFGLPDFVLKASIARYDGNIYQNYFDIILQAPNSTGMPPYHGKYIRPLTEKFSQIPLEKTRNKTQ
ncbi:hypothetical protein G6F70_000203 [Rhizopus microsporus]|uniref:Fatty-acyl coenzyme A oxidase n=2 Tax=Rhizopus TaxID=4842 RepID=A0A367JLN4_RHIAZ|nr:hypothetical protein G6F71_001673 [Rhizopus microsporus]RCH90836.1 fatty-acyl coenzyme A oxidase [Rhizopus azygosporus]KAG1204751.1 hypothetical protein G6F70_000203 [Rhizopus microsporus]KAG1216079.1 hypothetical protein G6F69_000399 [Rhizopus microsporus]KAG1238161.1 hypothetical protein G6F67_000624 [Rhizopus microsporus]